MTSRMRVQSLVPRPCKITTDVRSKGNDKGNKNVYNVHSKNAWWNRSGYARYAEDVAPNRTHMLFNGHSERCVPSCCGRGAPQSMMACP